jgi:hypothetical protein
MNSDQQRTWAKIAESPANYYVTASDSEREIMRDWVHGILAEREMTITFRKADGDLREMRCTLQESVAPKIVRETAEPRKYNPDICVVWDLDRQAWRSFRWDRITRIEFAIG